jgi:DHA2 family multidrug resistance protein
LARRSSFHQSRLVAALPQTGYQLQQQTFRFQHYLGSQFGQPQGKSMALAAVYHLLQQQALLLSFIDIFRWSALVSAVAAALGWLFHRMAPHHEGDAAP